jgi:opacity protein-like surface antigen
MQMKPVTIVLALLALLATDADAQKWEFTAFGGYRWGGELSDGSTSDGTVNVSDLQFEDGPCWGLTAGYNINPRFEVELLFDRQHTSFKFMNERLGADSTLGDGKLEYLMGGISINLLDPEYKLMPYFTFYLGAAHLVPDGAESNWFSALGYSLGVTYFFTENFGALIENRGTSTIVTDSSTLFCSEDNPDDCIVLPSDTWMWQVGLSVGVVVAF